MKRFDLAIVIAAVAIVAGGLGFGIGHATAPKATASASNGTGGSSANGSRGFGGQGGGGMRRGFGTRGTVTAISGNTITLKDDSGAARTINVTSSTSYLDGSNRSSSSLSAISSGSTILASGQTGSDGSINATRIIINPPNFGSGQGSATPSGNSGSAPSN